MTKVCYSCSKPLEDLICEVCNGSGEGYHDGTTCSTCNGYGGVDVCLYCDGEYDE